MNEDKEESLQNGFIYTISDQFSFLAFCTQICEMSFMLYLWCKNVQRFSLEYEDCIINMVVHFLEQNIRVDEKIDGRKLK
ncbi:unnamed protein product [Paramecium sonneborni]|uniref:Uncharacterized protein n=1 Tax=Paramecium sonneborni TaxID=65129 RepID=A0A8S1P688_9CILI|nr:unnamed protein product [Paramecium sonneborni]